MSTTPGMNKRSIEVAEGTCLMGTSGRDYIKSAAFDASTVSAVGGVSEQQLLTLTGSPGGGTFKLSYRGQETSALTYDESAADIQTALRALANIGSTGVTVAGSNGGPWTVTFAGPLANTDVFMLQLSTNSLTGGTTPSMTIAQSVQGVTYDPRYLVGSATYPGTIVAKKVVSGAPDKVVEYTAQNGVAEAQTLTVTGTPAGGTFKLAYRGDVTEAIAYNATAATVATELNKLQSVTEDGGVAGTGGALPGTPVVITFTEVGARVLVSLNTNSMTGGTTPTLTPTETTAGVNADAIYGILDGQEEFLYNSVEASRNVAIYVAQCVFDASKIKNYATYKEQFDAWAAANFNRVENAA